MGLVQEATEVLEFILQLQKKAEKRKKAWEGSKPAKRVERLNGELKLKLQEAKSRAAAPESGEESAPAKGSTDAAAKVEANGTTAAPASPSASDTNSEKDEKEGKDGSPQPEAEQKKTESDQPPAASTQSQD